MDCLDISHRCEVISAYQTHLRVFFTKHWCITAGMICLTELERPSFWKCYTSLTNFYSLNVFADSVTISKCSNLSTYLALKSVQKMQKTCADLVWTCTRVTHACINACSCVKRPRFDWRLFCTFSQTGRCTLSITTLRKHMNAYALIRDVWFISVECEDEVVFIVLWDSFRSLCYYGLSAELSDWQLYNSAMKCW